MLRPRSPRGGGLLDLTLRLGGPMNGLTVTTDDVQALTVTTDRE